MAEERHIDFAALGTGTSLERPHLAIEVIWTSGGVGKLDLYRRLGVAEVTLDPGMMGGPCIRGIRITVGTIAGLLADLEHLEAGLERVKFSDNYRSHRREQHWP